MNFNEFLKYKEQVLKENPKIINWAENNLYDFFNFNILIKETKTEYYRCHLVEDYLKMLKLDDNLKKNIGASNGVRQSLELLMKHLNNWEIPLDVYPFYNKTMQETNKNFSTYPTLVEDELFTNIQGKTLLICYPLKPMGRNYSSKEIENLKSFLQKSSDHLLVIDLVYWMNEFPEEVMELYTTNQVIICHSLSKIFLKPNIFGITLLPNNELGGILRNYYIKLDKQYEKLHLAYNLINYNQDNIKILIHSLNNLTNLLFINNSKNPSYLFYSKKSPEYFFQKGILVIPESVFGGIGKGSIISTLVKQLS